MEGTSGVNQQLTSHRLRPVEAMHRIRFNSQTELLKTDTKWKSLAEENQKPSMKRWGSVQSLLGGKRERPLESPLQPLSPPSVAKDSPETTEDRPNSSASSSSSRSSKSGGGSSSPELVLATRHRRRRRPRKLASSQSAGSLLLGTEPRPSSSPVVGSKSSSPFGGLTGRQGSPPQQKAAYGSKWRERAKSASLGGRRWVTKIYAKGVERKDVALTKTAELLLNPLRAKLANRQQLRQPRRLRKIPSSLDFKRPSSAPALADKKKKTLTGGGDSGGGGASNAHTMSSPVLLRKLNWEQSNTSSEHR